MIVFFFSPQLNFTYYFRVVRLIIKLRVFPFFYQIVFVFNLLERYQCFVVSTFPKIVPFFLLRLMINVRDFPFVLVVRFLTVFVGGFYRMFAANVKELIG